MSKKPASNPFLSAAATPFSLQDSFGGAQPALLVPTSPAPAVPAVPIQSAVSDSFNMAGLPPLPVSQATPSATPTPSLSTVSSASSLASMANQFNASQAVAAAAPPMVAPPPMVAGLGPPPPGVFLLPSATTAPSAPPGVSATNPLASGGPRSRYVAPPGINSTGAPVIAPGAALPPPVMNPVMTPSPSMPSMNKYAEPPMMQPTQPATMENAYSGMTQPAASLSMFQTQQGAPASALEHHWFYQVLPSTKTEPHWKPFSMVDSLAIEEIFMLNSGSGEPIATDGGRFDVNVAERNMTAVFWKQEVQPIRRCSWFYKSNIDGRWIPYDESTATALEDDFTNAASSGQWNRRLELGTGEHIMLHSPAAMMHFSTNSSSLSANLDDWGQVQPQDPQLKPRVVHRGLEGLPDIPDGETSEVDHLIFMIHGIGSACDIKFRPINEVVDGYRELSTDLSDRHFQSAHLSGRANRVEYLPVNWHDTLHDLDAGTDNRLKPLTLKSIPKMRGFMNDTLLDILFYTSPAYCQTICNTVVSEINRMYTLFMARNEGFKGTVSLIGHSLGSLILFDVLSNQTLNDAAPTSTAANHKAPSAAPVLSSNPAEANWTLEQIFEHLSLTSFIPLFAKDAIDVDTLMMCSDADLEEQGLPAEERKKLVGYLAARKTNKKTGGDGLNAYQQSSVESEVKYLLGPNGLGQPSVDYPQLCFEPAAFYAFGSPISMFLAVRGISSLGPDFHFPACPRFFNIFHPFDPVAYRVEAIISPEYEHLRPVVIPHHMGRKRMHLELKDTVTKLMTTDIKQKIIDSVSSTLTTFYNIATGTAAAQGSTGEAEHVKAALEDSMNKKAAEDDEADARNPRTLDSKLNAGSRIDYVLQEAPLESFNEYLFALASHLCYWESEDTCLMVLKDVYEQMSIYSDDSNALGLPRAQSAPGGFVPPSAPTPILRPPVIPMGGAMHQSTTPIMMPPPTPMGGTMQGPPTILPTESKTPILMPPPTPMGGAMQGPPAMLSTSSTTPILMPPTTPMGGSMQGPSKLNTPNVVAPSPVPLMTPSSMALPPQIQSTPIASATLFTSPSPVSGPPPMMMATPSSAAAPPPVMPATSFGGGSYPTSPPPATTMGYDPTAPIDFQKPVGPPPVMGFMQKK